MAGKINVLLLGAGKIGGAIVEYLAGSGDYLVAVADQDELALAPDGARGCRPHAGQCHRRLGARQGGVGDEHGLERRCHFISMPLSPRRRAMPARTTSTSPRTSTTTRAVTARSPRTRTIAFMPQCGLAPGFVSIAADDLAKIVRRAFAAISMRVGALPQFPTNALKYNLTWSTDGLINEYCNPCEAIVDGKHARGAAARRARGTSRSTASTTRRSTPRAGSARCARRCDGKVETLNYKTVRYPGHRDVIKTADQRPAARRRRAICSRTSWRPRCRSPTRTWC